MIIEKETREDLVYQAQLAPFFELKKSQAVMTVPGLSFSSNISPGIDLAVAVGQNGMIRA